MVDFYNFQAGRHIGNRQRPAREQAQGSRPRKKGSSSTVRSSRGVQR